MGPHQGRGPLQDVGPQLTGGSHQNGGPHLNGGPLLQDVEPLQSVGPHSFEGRLGGVASSAADKKTAQQKAALKLLQQHFPQLLQLVEDGPWNEARSAAQAEQEMREGIDPDLDPDPVSAAAFLKAAAVLRATTPSNTLNNLCLVRLHGDKHQ